VNRKPKMSEVLTPALVSAVNVCLLARAAAETMRERVRGAAVSEGLRGLTGVLSICYKVGTRC